MAGLPQRLHKIDVQIGHRLKDLRIQSGVSQRDLGEMLGVGFQQIQRYESGENRLAGSTLWEISQKFGVPITWFFDDLEE